MKLAFSQARGASSLYCCCSILQYYYINISQWFTSWSCPYKIHLEMFFREHRHLELAQVRWRTRCWNFNGVFLNSHLGCVNFLRFHPKIFLCRAWISDLLWRNVYMFYVIAKPSCIKRPNFQKNLVCLGSLSPFFLPLWWSSEAESIILTQTTPLHFGCVDTRYFSFPSPLQY